MSVSFYKQHLSSCQTEKDKLCWRRELKVVPHRCGSSETCYWFKIGVQLKEKRTFPLSSDRKATGLRSVLPIFTSCRFYYAWLEQLHSCLCWSISKKRKVTSKLRQVHKNNTEDVEYIALDNQPLCVVENTGFCSLMDFLEPRYELPSRHYIADKALSELVSKICERVHVLLADATAISFTTFENRGIGSVSARHVKNWIVSGAKKSVSGHP